MGFILTLIQIIFCLALFIISGGMILIGFGGIMSDGFNLISMVLFGVGGILIIGNIAFIKSGF